MPFTLSFRKPNERSTRWCWQRPRHVSSCRSNTSEGEPSTTRTSQSFLARPAKYCASSVASGFENVARRMGSKYVQREIVCCVKEGRFPNPFFKVADWRPPLLGTNPTFPAVAAVLKREAEAEMKRADVLASMAVR